MDDSPTKLPRNDKDFKRHLKKLFLDFDEYPHFVLPKTDYNALKKFFRTNADLVLNAYESCILQMSRRDSRVRYRCLLFLREVISRSIKARESIESDFDEIVEKCILGDSDKSQLVNSGLRKSKSSRSKVIGTRGKRKSVYTSKFIRVRVLPEPANVAIDLRDLGLRTVEEWKEVYGPIHPKFIVGYNYLKNSLHLKFPDIRSENIRMGIEREERKKYAQRILLAKYTRVLQDVDSNLGDMIITLKEATDILLLIVPDFNSMLQAVLEDPTYKNESVYEYLKASSRSTTDEVQGQEYAQDNQAHTSSIPQQLTSSETFGKEHSEESPRQEIIDDSIRSVTIENFGLNKLIEARSMKDSGENIINEDEEEDEWENIETENQNDEIDISDFEDLINFSTVSNKEVVISLKSTINDIKTKENKEIFDILSDKMKEIMTRYKPMIEEWYNIVSRVEVDEKEHKRYEKLYKTIIELKYKIDDLIKKCERMQMNLEFEPSSIYKVPQVYGEEELGKRKRDNSSTFTSSKVQKIG